MYAQDLMRTRLLASVLMLLLSGADSGAAMICAASCMSSAPVPGPAVHHNEMESRPTATHASQHTHSHGAACTKCPPKGNSLSQKHDCKSQSEIQALTEGFFSLNGPTGVAQVLASRPSEDLALASDRDQSFFVGGSATARSSGPPPSVPLRI